LSFIDTTQPSDEAKSAWVDYVGLYWYYSLCLAEYNPNLALQIYDNPAHKIAEAIVTKRCAEYIKPKE